MGMIFDIQRCSYEDGPGLRTTVFLKGCPLRCAWCHNPESFRRAPQLQFFSHRCSSCGTCAEVCPRGAHRFDGDSLDDNSHTIDFARCTACGSCAAACPSGALKIVGQEMTAAQVVEIVLRDKAYFDASGGGVTFSGGEPTDQPEFLIEMLRLSRAAGLHTCVETNGYIKSSVLPPVIEFTDLFLLDYKVTDPDALRSLTGATGELWFQTLDALQSAHKPVWLRLPIIPGINDDDGHFESAAKVVRGHSCIERAEIMPYHAIGVDKWHQLGYHCTLASLPTVPAEQAEHWQKRLDSLIALQTPPSVQSRS